MRAPLTASLLAVASLLLATPTWAQEADGNGGSRGTRTDGQPDAVELTGWFGIGAGGTAESTISVELDPTIDLGARLEAPVVTEYFVIGGQFQMSFWRPAPENDRSTWFDFDAIFKGRTIFDVGGYALELYGVMPVGFTVSTRGGGPIAAGPGWNIGLLFGTQFYFLEDLAFVLEMGWQHHHTWHNTSLGDIDYKANQFVMNFGIAIPF